MTIFFTRSVAHATWIGCALFVAVALPGQPGSAAEDPTLVEYRRLFTLLESKGPAKVAKERVAWPKQELLASYLEYEILAHSQSRPTIAEIRRFLERWPDHPLLAKVQTLMDLRMAELGEEAEALAWYDQRPNLKPASARVRYLQLLLLKKRVQDADPWWRNLYRSSTGISLQLRQTAEQLLTPLLPEDHEIRARALLADKRLNDFSQQLPFLPAGRRAYWQAMQAAVAGDRHFDDLVSRLPPADAASSELWFSRIDWLREKGYPQLARSMLLGKEGARLEPQHRSLLSYRLGRHYFYQEQDVEASYQLLKGNTGNGGRKELDESLWLQGWTAFLTNHMDEAVEPFQRLAKDSESIEWRSQGGYWASRALNETRGNSPIWLALAAGYPDTFYGLLALEERKDPLPPAKDESEKACPLQNDGPEVAKGVSRLRTLLAVDLGRYIGGEIDWLGTRLALSPQDRLCLAKRFGDPDLLIKMARELRRETGTIVWNALYPIPTTWKPVNGWELDTSLIWSLVRQESMFRPNAKSVAGARGLMQLMPATATHVANRLGLPRPSVERLEQPAYNLALGQYYIQNMLEMFKGDLALALAGYNAGPGRALKWKPSRAATDPLHFIEQIPITETRLYVKKVVHNLASYRLRTSGVVSMRGLISAGMPGLDSFVPAKTLAKE